MVSDETRVMVALRRIERWASTLEANAVALRVEEPTSTALIARARALEARARDLRDVGKILSGEEDSYIEGLLALA